MNRRLLILPVVGAAALAGTQLLGGDTEPPPEPAFPTVVNQTDATWVDDAWSVNRFVDDPFDPSTDAGFDPGQPIETGPAPQPEDEGTDTPVAPTTPAAGSSGAPAPAPTTTTAAPAPTTTAPAPTTTRDLSQAPPLADDGSGVDVPEIDDLPDPLGAGDDTGR